MEGDAFYHLTGQGCVLNRPYPDNRVSTLRDNISVARNKEAIAHAARDAAHKDWAECKRKLFCNASKKNSRLNDRESEHNASKMALETAEKDLNQALTANKQAQSTYDKCHAEEVKLQEEERKQQQEKLKQQQQLEIEHMKVGAVNFENGKEYALYGLIGLGIATSIVVAIFAFK